jgi:methyl-accepting chemotaxis protein
MQKIYASRTGTQEEADARALWSALSKSQAIIEFDLEGTILDANDSFLSLMGYEIGEVQGRHHRIFCDPVEVASSAYAAFWSNLARGEHEAGVYKRVAKDGQIVWMQATYNPVTDLSGKPIRILKIATDITASRLAAADAASRLQALGRSQGVIEFALDGTILDANDNFLAAVGYSREDLVGQHHSILCGSCPGWWCRSCGKVARRSDR